MKGEGGKREGRRDEGEGKKQQHRRNDGGGKERSSSVGGWEGNRVGGMKGEGGGSGAEGTV